MISRFLCLLFACSGCFAADETSQPSLTIYNQDFAVVREVLPLDLKAGVNSVKVNDITMHLEPDSVILRDPTGKHSLQVLEQNYRADSVSQQLMLSLFEGKTIDFQLNGEAGPIVPGKIIRSGYVPQDYIGVNRYGQQYFQSQGYAQDGRNDPLIEVNGKLRFGLPGLPLFPALGDDSILKPTLLWLLSSDKPGKISSEFSYVTGGLTWQADYNIVAAEKGDIVDLVGWVTIDNQSGKSFENAHIKLMAGDVNKIQPPAAARMVAQGAGVGGGIGAGVFTPPVTERAFDEYHLYTLARTTTLLDREIKQVEFIRASGIIAKQVYVYDGAKIDSRYNGWNYENIRNDHSYGTESNPKVWVMREFVNSDANHLGMPLPKGRLRFYRRDDTQLEFTGENVIDHTSRDETVRVYTGNAFDVAGERKQTNYTADISRHFADESFEIKIRNHKKEPVNVRVVEHLYRWTNWDISSSSDTYKKTDAQTIEFPVTIAPDQEKVITYTAHYSW
jgi:hypothetical protein